MQIYRLSLLRWAIPVGRTSLEPKTNRSPRTNHQLFAELAAAKLGLETSVKQSLDARTKRRTDVRITLDLDYVSLHTHTENNLPLTLSSPYQRLDLAP